MKQKEEHLQQIIQTLATDYKDGVPMSAIRVENISNPSNVFDIICNTTNDELIQDYGSAEKFFENLSKSNVKSVRVSPLKRNGVCTTKYGAKITWKRSTKIEPLKMSFTSNGSQEEVKETVQSKQEIVHNYPVPMNGGLSGSDYHKIYDHQRLQSENSDLKAKNELLEKENKCLEKEVLTSELVGQKSVEKAQAQAELLKTGQGYIPLVLEALKAITANKNPVPKGMTGVLSRVKQNFMQTDDEVLEELEQVGLRFDNQNFIDELKLLIDKYPLNNG